MAPDVNTSTKEEREEYIKDTFKCISDCESCGLCKIFRGKSPEVAYKDYIEGLKDYLSVSSEYR